MNSMLKTTINVNHSYKQSLQYGFLQQSFVVFTYCTVPKKSNTEIQHGPKYKVNVLAKCK